MGVPGNYKFREWWWKQILADPEVVGNVLAAALAISTEARRDGTRALMSNQRLAEILRKDERMVSRYTKQLRDLGYLMLVERGHRRGDGTLAANVYELFLRDTQMSSRDESQQDTKMSSRDSAEQQHTEFSTGQNEISTGQNEVSTGHPDVYPLLNPPLVPPSETSVSASLAPQARAHGNGSDSDENDLVAIEDELDEELGLDQQEMNLADAMLQRGAHQNAVRNTINKQRLGGTFNDVKQDQKRLDEEEPRCQVQTCRQPKSKHAQWMAMLDETDRHEFAP